MAFYIFRRFLKTEEKTTTSFVVCPSVPVPKWNSASTRTIFRKLDISTVFFRRTLNKIKILLKSDKNNEYFSRTPMYIYDNISLNFFRMRNISYKLGIFV